MSASPRKLTLRRETVRSLVPDDLERAQGGSILDATTVLIRKTIETVLSIDTQCASSCLTDPPTCLCPSYPCPTD